MRTEKLIVKKNEIIKNNEVEIVYERGKISDIPDDFSRKNMFMEIDLLEKGWEVSLSKRKGSDIINATFYSPSGEEIGPFVKARKMALSSSSKQ